ncbi:MAG: hypothetical protein MI861_21475 [Pirellulales bacterium]|nr:hypothetical protein [Pirellulales bacterium]
MLPMTDPYQPPLLHGVNEDALDRFPDHPSRSTRAARLCLFCSVVLFFANVSIFVVGQTRSVGLVFAVNKFLLANLAYSVPPLIHAGLAVAARNKPVLALHLLLVAKLSVIRMILLLLNMLASFLAIHVLDQEGLISLILQLATFLYSMADYNLILPLYAFWLVAMVVVICVRRFKSR